MENILSLITIDDNERNMPTLNHESYPFRICDIPLPRCKTGFVYFLLSVRTQDYTYIGECKCIVTRLYQHNSGHGSKSMTPSNRRPFAVLGYICGFNGTKKALRRQLEKQWKEKRDFLKIQGINDPKEWFHCGKHVIQDLDDDEYKKEKQELRFVELISDN